MNNQVQTKDESFEKADKFIVTGNDGTIIEMVKEPIVAPRFGDGIIYWGRVSEMDLIVKELKIPDGSAEDTALLIERFKKTSELTANIDDTPDFRGRVGRVRGLVESKGKLYLLLYPYFKKDSEFNNFNALTLENQLKPNRELSKHQVFGIITQLSQIVMAFHKNGIYHMDLKLANIIYYHDIVKLIDFGLCIDRRKGILAKDRIPDPTNIAGSFEYTSPERINAALKPDQSFDFDPYASEIFSFAAIAFRVITRKSLFKEANAHDIVESITQIDLSDPSNYAAFKFNKNIDELAGFGYTADQRELIKEAFKLILTTNIEQRLENFPGKFLRALEKAFD